MLHGIARVTDQSRRSAALDASEVAIAAAIAMAVVGAIAGRFARAIAVAGMLACADGCVRRVTLGVVLTSSWDWGPKRAETRWTNAVGAMVLRALRQNCIRSLFG